MKQEVLEGDLKESPGFSCGEKSMLSITTGASPVVCPSPQKVAREPPPLGAGRNHTGLNTEKKNNMSMQETERAITSAKDKLSAIHSVLDYLEGEL